MPNSLRAKLKKLNYEGKITDEELNDLIDELDRLYKVVQEIKHAHWLETEAIYKAHEGKDIIRCKDCKYWVHYEGDNKGRCIDGLSINGDDMAYVETNEDDFCSYAEKEVE